MSLPLHIIRPGHGVLAMSSSLRNSTAAGNSDLSHSSSSVRHCRMILCCLETNLTLECPSVTQSILSISSWSAHKLTKDE
ncbi:hypothetical protein Mp_4g07360 [Marchantia polymorpha subsp. ruderalis]|uniref:Uncharacterized protein n=2 Tax=Marchantia polymorpha TaxID=3197 RepID=A0AAF6B7E2_MARPO|nr:hypothetical protein MARPO_0115s0045 [Marchantia polymorpha]BBN07926.1 hypothetical protein Mp_4g07360 [Marchantia polymorpha subsp. ruderalis]|eukprot:PTQ31128.1 hypothetical protein MARPO_0115s0045 [Marchantia polymorpha]